MLYIFDDIQAFTDSDLIAAYGLVSGARSEKARRYVRIADRKLSVIAELLLMRAIGLQRIDIEYVGNHKPVFADRGLPHFNLSHCALGVACAVGPAPVGVDIEPYASYDEETARTVFNPAELATALDAPRRFAELWTTKESYLKFTGQGLTDNLPALLPGVAGAKFVTYHSPKGYACTVCAADPIDCHSPIFIDKTTLLNG